MNKIAVMGVLLVALLTACESMPPPPNMGNSPDLPPMALRFQKKGQFGHTDYDLRKADMIECGLLRGKYEDSLTFFEERYSKEAMSNLWDRQWRFFVCMEAKDYLLLGREECGTVKENRGICK
jgi:hypothetical protein